MKPGLKQEVEAVVDQRITALAEYRLVSPTLQLPGPSPSTSDPKENWFKRNAYWFNPVLAFVLGSGIGLKIAVLPIDNEIDKKLKPLTDSLSEVKIKLNTVETQQKGWTELVKMLLPERVKRLSSTPGPELQKELPAIQATFEAAKAHEVNVPAQEVRLIRTQLSKAPESDQLWAAAAAVIAYASPRPIASLRSCGDVPPAAGTGSFANGYFKPGPMGPTWTDCNLDLNAELTSIEQQAFRDLAKRPFYNINCLRCNITYAGGNIPILTGSLKNIHLIDCSFRYLPKIAPSPIGESAVRSILAATELKDVDIRS